MMMLHEWYREKLAARRRELEARLHAAEETARAAVAQLQEERGAQQAWNERRLRAQENGAPFDEPMPNGTGSPVLEQLQEEQAAANAWYERRIAAAEKGEPFDEPPPNGVESS